MQITRYLLILIISLIAYSPITQANSTDSVTAKFSSYLVHSGDSVTYSWTIEDSSISWYCVVTGLPGGQISGTGSGTKTFIAQGGTLANIRCTGSDEWMGLHLAEATTQLVTYSIPDSVTASFSSSPAIVGSSVTFSWDAVSQTPSLIWSCKISGLPGGEITRSGSGTKTFTVQQAISVHIGCFANDEWMGLHFAETTTELSTTISKPTIDINFPSVVAMNAKNTLKIEARHHNSCELRASYPGEIKSFTSSSARYEVVYKQQGNFKIQVVCNGPGGRTEKKKDVFVGPPVTAAITKFSNDEIIGQTTSLNWNSVNTDRCKIQYANNTYDVNTFGNGFPVTLGLVDKTYTLSCFQDNASVSKLLTIPARVIDCNQNKYQIRECELRKTEKQITSSFNQIDDLNNPDLTPLGIDLNSDKLTQFFADIDGDGNYDLLVHDQVKKSFYVLINQAGVFNKIASKTFNISDVNQVDSIEFNQTNQIEIKLKTQSTSYLVK